MKNKVIIGIVAGFVLLAGGALRVEASDSFNTGIMPLKEVVTNSPIIVYASVDTNSLPTIHLTITDVYKRQVVLQSLWPVLPPKARAWMV